MSGPSSAREALIAEALGEMAALLDRVEALKPALAEVCEEVTQSRVSLVEQATLIESRVAALADAAAAHVVKHVARRADELVRAAASTETRAMEAAARQLFREELAPTLQRLATSLSATASRGPSLARTWMAHALTAIVASAVTLAASLWLLPR